jgi:hypothetical protein
MIPKPQPFTYTWDEVEEDRYHYNEGLGLCGLERLCLPTSDQHRLAMERVERSRRQRCERYHLRLFGVEEWNN